jgi:3-hydroxyacyl-[acyl-carrier-protein] dehydratase
MQLNSDEIEKLLPHRYPFLLVDRITKCEPGKLAEGRKCVTANEPFFQGHFPGRKIMPGVLILEALAQTGAVALLSGETYKGKLALFGGIRSARFRRQVVPGDVLELKCEIISMKGPAGIGKATAFVDGETAVSAELIFALADR